MTIFALSLSRFSNFIADCLGRWRRHARDVPLDNLSDRGLKDIGIEPCHRDFDTVKPFWMP